MNRDELLAVRDELQAKVAERKQLGDYDTNAATIRLTLEAALKLAQHLLDRMPKR